MSTNTYTTRQMIGVIDSLERPSSFLLDTFFGNAQYSDTDVIDFDVVTKGRQLAPFVSPSVKGKMMRNRGGTTKTFRPAYLKPKSTVDPSKPLTRKAGESYGGSMSAGQRHDAHVTEILVDQRESILRRKEWMAASALVTGTVTVVGEDYPEQTVDFGRDASLSVTLTGAARWGEAGVNPLDDIEDWAALGQSKSGAPMTTVIMEPEAWKLARKNTDFRDALDIRRQASGSVELGPIARGQGNDKARYVGSIGDFDFWVYQEVYEDKDGVEQNLIPDHAVILAGSAIEGVQAQGAIHDPRAGWAAEELFPTNWVSDDPVAEFVMTQSAPLVVPGRPNNSFCAIVR